MAQKEKLIKSLNSVIRALENDTVNYDWYGTSTCNCGVVSQALLGLQQNEFSDKITLNNLYSHKWFEPKKEGGLGYEKNWKNAVKLWCPITNKPLKDIFIELNDAGLSADDICHLEFMENKAILAKSGIVTHREFYKDVQSGVNYVPDTTFFGRLFNRKVAVPVYEKKKFVEPIAKYYTHKDNLIKYLKAWVSILKDERDPIEDDLSNYHINELNERLLVAVADEDYNTAIKLRDAISEYKG